MLKYNSCKKLFKINQVNPKLMLHLLSTCLCYGLSKLLINNNAITKMVPSWFVYISCYIEPTL